PALEGAAPGGQPDPTAVQAALGALDCTAGHKDPLVGNDDPKLPLATCDQKNPIAYVLGKSFLDGTDITTAASQLDTQGAGYVVPLDFNSNGSKIWGDYTTAHNDQTSPGGQNAAAFVLDTEVVSAPTIQTPITGGQTRITGGNGGFTQTASRDLANVLKYG